MTRQRDFMKGLLLGTLLTLGLVGARTALASIEPLKFKRATFTAVASSGTTPVLLAAGATDLVLVPAKTTFRNADTAWHTLSLLSGTTVIFPVELPPGGSFALDNDDGVIRCDAGDPLQFKVDSGSMVTVSGTALQGRS